MSNNSKYMIENFGLYKLMVESCGDDKKEQCKQEIVEYGKKFGVDFLSENWSDVLLDIFDEHLVVHDFKNKQQHANVKILTKEMKSFEIVKKYATIIDYLDISEIKDKFVELVCDFVLIERHYIYNGMYADISCINCENISVNPEYYYDVYFFFVMSFDLFREWLFTWTNIRYSKCITAEYMLLLNNFHPIEELKIMLPCCRYDYSSLKKFTCLKKITFIISECIEYAHEKYRAVTIEIPWMPETTGINAKMYLHELKNDLNINSKTLDLNLEYIGEIIGECII
jgi:hypothetical protein